MFLNFTYECHNPIFKMKTYNTVYIHHAWKFICSIFFEQHHNFFGSGGNGILLRITRSFRVFPLKADLLCSADLITPTFSLKIGVRIIHGYRAFSAIWTPFLWCASTASNSEKRNLSCHHLQMKSLLESKSFTGLNH